MRGNMSLYIRSSGEQVADLCAADAGRRIGAGVVRVGHWPVAMSEGDSGKEGMSRVVSPEWG